MGRLSPGPSPSSCTTLEDAHNDVRQHTACLKIIVVGAGLSGLATAIACAEAGHSVVLLESAEKIEAVGAGIQITPNGARLLRRWKLPDSLWDKAAEPTLLYVRRYRDGKVLSRELDFDKTMHKRYQAPFIDIHRADLQGALVERATQLGVEFRLGEKVAGVDSERTELITVSGKRFRRDLIVGADGLWSRCRECLLGKEDKPVATGDLAYRIIIKLEKIPDQDLREMVSRPQLNFWIGPQSHVSRQPGSVEEMRKLFADWDPILQRFLNLVTKVEKWKLMYRPALESWINAKSNFTLIGDACHPMLPYLAQGANSAIEDGAVLGAVVAKITAKHQLPQALQMYERLRKSRGDAIAREAFGQREAFHMPDGPAQQARDAVLAKQLEVLETTEKFPSRWSCPIVQPWLFGYDALSEVENALKEDPFTSMAQEKL